MVRSYRRFDEDFKQGAVALVVETGKPIARVARDLGINDGTLGNWCAQQRRVQEGPFTGFGRARRAGAAASPGDRAADAA